MIWSCSSRAVYCSSADHGLIFSFYVPDMPEGLHGIFPLPFNKEIYIAGGADVSSASQTTAFYKFTPSNADISS